MPEADRDRTWLAAARVTAGQGKVRSRLSSSPGVWPKAAEKQWELIARIDTFVAAYDKTKAPFT